MQQTSLNITAAHLDPALFDLPWHIPLEDWPEDLIAAFPRGISRHIVRFVRLSGRVIAIKEIGEVVAHHEYDQLRALRRLDVPSVVPLAVITRSEEHTSELQSRGHLVCRLLLEQNKVEIIATHSYHRI